MTSIGKLSNLRGKLLPNQCLADYTSWRTGGPADYVYIPADLADLSLFLHQLEPTMPLAWLGLGSNTLVRDSGVEGVVIVTQGALTSLTHSVFMLHEQSEQLLEVVKNKHQLSQIVRAEAGVSSAQLARYTARLGLAGLEFMAGVPGTVGGALAMNAGCYGGETWGFVEHVEVMNRQGEIKMRSTTDFVVGYRCIIRPADEWFVAGYFKLSSGDKEQLLSNIRVLLDKRNQAQPMGTANCGSVFRNPPGNYAGKLIEKCGLKGKRLGGASISEKHANFIINQNHATSADIENLIREIGTIVEQQTGVRLIPEVCIIGR
jgi:UDP-N-acetylmuramate dehydrogenase